MSKGSNYYGGFFGVALISFIVPLFVGWKAFQNIQPTTKPTPQLDASGVDVAFFDYDWALNSQADPGAPASQKKKSGGFGSGSSPDE